MESISPSGQRYNPNKTDSEINGYNNLLFLCYQHHKETDNVELYSVQIKVDIFTGYYFNGNEFESSELQVTYSGGNLIHVKGDAFWGKTREYGPNIGQFDFVTEVSINKAKFSDKLFNAEYCLEMEFKGDKLIINEKYLSGYFGMNVSFGGEYIKIIK